MVEDGGLCTKNVLSKSNQFPRDECGRDDCVICLQREENKSSVQCVKRSVGYEGECVRCPTKHAYIGESSRTAYTRVKEHLSDYRAASAAQLPPLDENSGGGGSHGFGNRKKCVKSWMWEHSRDCHGGQVGERGGIADYKFRVTGVFRKCLDRQIDEGLRITACETEGGVLLNSKNEFFTPINCIASVQAAVTFHQKQL